MRPFLVFFHVFVCLILIMVVLLQAGRGASMGAAFGGSSQTIFGSAGAGTFLGKMTAIIAIFFMLTTLGLSYFSSEKTSSVVRGFAPPKAVEETVPQETPAPPPAAPAPQPGQGN